VAELSPAAQAVLHSFWDAPVSPARNCQIAAALRAAADQANVDGWTDALELIRAIADELEDVN
jgi:hypothetical protein